MLRTLLVAIKGNIVFLGGFRKSFQIIKIRRSNSRPHAAPLEGIMVIAEIGRIGRLDKSFHIIGITISTVRLRTEQLQIRSITRQQIAIIFILGKMFVPPVLPRRNGIIESGGRLVFDLNPRKGFIRSVLRISFDENLFRFLYKRHCFVI